MSKATLIPTLVLICCFTFFILVIAEPGTASFYNPPYVPSACYGKANHGIHVAAASESMWSNGTVCGKKYYVSCMVEAYNNKTRNPCKKDGVTVTIVDHCPKCNATINLSRHAFTLIANPRAGVVNVKYTGLSMDYPSPRGGGQAKPPPAPSSHSNGSKSDGIRRVNGVLNDHIKLHMSAIFAATPSPAKPPPPAM